jgi:hypothetical protein
MYWTDQSCIERCLMRDTKVGCLDLAQAKAACCLTWVQNGGVSWAAQPARGHFGAPAPSTKIKLWQGLA